MINEFLQERTRYFKREDPENRAYRWYELTIGKSGDLFNNLKVTIKRGRLGQKGETIERFFNTYPDAEEYFNSKVNERLRRGYSEVCKITPTIDPTCGFCKLLETPTNEASFVFQFKNTLLFLNWDQTYKGRSLLIFKNHIPDFFRLAPSEILSTLSEIRRSEEALRNAFSAKLMNYLFMGNRAGHVHIHLVPRYPDDPNFGNSPFLSTSQTEKPQLTDQEYRTRAKEILKYLSPSFKKTN